MEQFNFNSRVAILCDGEFPNHPVALSHLHNADSIICCDGAADKLIDFGMEPAFIVGDLDSVSENIKIKYADRMFENKDQETNDQTKAVEFAVARGAKKLVILGATGKREDHTIGNISLLLDYASKVEVVSVTNNGVFIPVLSSRKFDSEKGQQISIFSVGIPASVTSINLKYSLNKTSLGSWWMGTLNEALGSWFSLSFDQGQIIVFKKFAK